MFSEKKSNFRSLVVCLLFLIACVFLFKNLGNMYLNVDEAETALLSKSVLKHGIPVGIDGNFAIQQNNISPYKSEASKIWIFHPWLQFYVTALSYAVFDRVDNFTSRFPFALSGLLTIVLFYAFLCRRKGFDWQFVVFALAVLVFSIPIYLYFRQCRYYALTCLFSFSFFALYIESLEKRRMLYYWAASGILLFYTNYAVFFPMYASVVVYVALYKRKEIKKIFIPSILMFLFTVPGAVYLEIWKRKEVVYSLDTVSFSNMSIFVRIAKYVRYINNYHISLVLILFLVLLLLWKGKIAGVLRYFNREIFQASFVAIFVNILFFSIVIMPDYRFFVHILPFLVIIIAGMLDFLRLEVLPEWSVIVILVIISISGNIINMLPVDLYLYLASFKATEKQLEDRSVISFKRLGFWPYRIDPETKKNPFLRALLTFVPDFTWSRYLSVREMVLHEYSLFDYIYEITHDYMGPVKGAVEFLRKNAKKGDKVKIYYGDLALQFYLGDFLDIIPRLKFHDAVYPRWWVLRGKKWRYLSSTAYAEATYEKLSLKHYKDYRLLGCPDVPYNNLPSPDYHYFRTYANTRPETFSDLVYDLFVFCRRDMLPNG